MPADAIVRLCTWRALGQRRADRGPEPLVTYVNASTGERTELSAISVHNAVAKIAGALRDEFDLDHTSAVGLHLPWHWQRSLWWGACATLGVRIVLDGQLVPNTQPDAVDLVACTLDDAATMSSVTSNREVLVVSLHPMGLPIAEPLPVGCADAASIVRLQPDHFAPADLATVDVHIPPGAQPGQRTLVCHFNQADAGRADTSHRRLDQASPAGPPEIGLGPSWDWALALPLALDGSVVMLSDTVVDGDSAVDPETVIDRVAEQERVDRVIVLEGQP